MSKNLKKVFFDHGDVDKNSTDQEPKITIIDKEKSLEERLPDFEVTSEHTSKNLKLRELTEEEKNSPTITNVKVYEEDGVTNVSPDELEKYINSNKRIKKVVIEKISVEDAARISMMFGNKANRKPKLIQGKGSESLKNAEMKLNLDFIGEVPTDKDDINGLISETEDVLNFNFPSEKQPEKKESLSEDLKEDISSLKDEIKVEEQITLVEDKKLSLKEDVEDIEFFDDKLEQLDEVDTKDIENYEESKTVLKDKTVHYDKQTFTRKKNSSHNGFYYRAKDHMELYKVGSSYMIDYNSGLKSIAFCGNSLRPEREKSVFGVTSYFNYHINIKICIVTMSFHESFYHEMTGDLDYRSVKALDENFDYKVFSGQGFDIIEFSELKKVERKLRHHDFEYFLDVLVEDYDLVLWDLPELDILNSNKELYFPIVRTVDNVSLIVGENYSKFKHIEQMIDYFNRYQINIKGVLVNKDKR